MHPMSSYNATRYHLRPRPSSRLSDRFLRIGPFAAVCTTPCGHDGRKPRGMFEAGFMRNPVGNRIKDRICSIHEMIDPVLGQCHLQWLADPVGANGDTSTARRPEGHNRSESRPNPKPILGPQTIPGPKDHI